LLGQEVSAEAIRLDIGAAGKIRSAETLRKAKVVLNFGTGACLTANGFAFDDDGTEPLGRRVDACREAGRAGTYDDDVVELLLGLTRHTELSGQLAGGGLDQGGAVAEDDNGKFAVVQAALFEQAQGLWVLLGVEPLIGNPVAGQELANVMVCRGPARTDNANAFVRSLVALLPCLEEIVQHGIELLFGWVPGFVEVVVNLRGVDGANRGFRVGV